MPIGLDLGTTNSSVSYWDESGLQLIELGLANEPYNSVLGTAVYRPPGGGRPITGRQALTAGSDGTLIASFKPRFNEERLREVVVVPRRRVTDDYDMVEQTAAVRTDYVPVAMYGDLSRDDVVGAASLIMRRLLRRLMETIPLSPEEMAAETLYLGVPVGYGPTARRRLLDAVVRTEVYGEGAPAYRLALDRVRFVYEPVSLMFAALDAEEAETVLVFDYGGGTLDLGIWRVQPAGADTQFRELAFGGHPRAGDALDRLIFEHLCARHPEYAAAAALARGPVEERLPMERVAAAKEALSRLDSYELLEGDAPRITLTREDIDEAIASELHEVEGAVSQCLERAGLRRHEIDRVVMSGGSSLLPCVRDLLWRLFPTVEGERFSWLDPTRAEDRARALTAVSQGLAEFGWSERFTAQVEQVLPGDLVVWSEPEACMVPVARRGTPLDGGPVSGKVMLPPETISLALYERIASERLVACLADLPVPSHAQPVEAVVEVHPLRFGLYPVVRVLVGGRVVGSFDVQELDDDSLLKFLRSDHEWLPSTGMPAAGFLARRLRKGDLVRLPGQLERGVVTSIRDIGSGRELEEMAGWRLGSGGCVVTVKWEDGAEWWPADRHSMVHLR